MESHIINTLLDRERVTSTYADIYFNDDYCKKENSLPEENVTRESSESVGTEWISPSDHLIGKVELIPPFTSKITRGKTHEGILNIGNEVLEREHKRFLASLTKQLQENDESWRDILINDEKRISKRVKEIFRDIFKFKSKTMSDEINTFYENTLQDLESHLQSEIINITNSVHANMISALNDEIPCKLMKERTILENILKENYITEVKKINTYYKLLLQNEIRKNSKLINYALDDRNEALQAFCRQTDAERLTSSMYIMSLQRKKCRIKKMLLEKYQGAELSEKMKTIKERQDVIESFNQREQKVSDINKQWEDKMKKILELFLKFISFSLKILPEQSTFLIDFQKMVVLQLNEMQKQPKIQTNILIDEDKIANILNFYSTEKSEENKVCDVDPFVIIGDLSDPIPPQYGSSETLPPDVDLPYLRVNRQYLYAKCHGYEDIKKFLDSQECKCRRQPSPVHSEILPQQEVELPQPSITTESSSSNEPLFVDDMLLRLKECPARNCANWTKHNLFPFMPSYVDFSEKNFERVKAILGSTPPKDKAVELISIKDIALKEIPFAATTEKYHHAETQYSTQEFDTTNVECTCLYENKFVDTKSVDDLKEKPSKLLAEALKSRKMSIRHLLDQNPNLLKVFTDESFDFQL